MVVCVVGPHSVSTGNVFVCLRGVEAFLVGFVSTHSERGMHVSNSSIICVHACASAGALHVLLQHGPCLWPRPHHLHTCLARRRLPPPTAQPPRFSRRAFTSTTAPSFPSMSQHLAASPHFPSHPAATASPHFPSHPAATASPYFLPTQSQLRRHTSLPTRPQLRRHIPFPPGTPAGLSLHALCRPCHPDRWMAETAQSMEVESLPSVHLDGRDRLGRTLLPRTCSWPVDCRPTVADSL
eukprot:364097-Chlamydomonas_euryale.AAC.4